MAETKTGKMTAEHKKFLDNLRKSGATNMFGAGPFVQRRFGVDKREAEAIVMEWMDSF